jgi:hypothetical protein
MFTLATGTSARCRPDGMNEKKIRKINTLSIGHAYSYYFKCYPLYQECLFNETNIHYLGLYAYSGVQHISCCVFALFFFVLYIVVSNTYCLVFLLCLQTLENTEGAIKYGQSRETGNIGYTRRRKTKQRHNTICVWHHYTQDEEKQSKDTTRYVLDTTIHKTKNKQSKNTIQYLYIINKLDTRTSIRIKQQFIGDIKVFLVSFNFKY